MFVARKKLSAAGDTIVEVLMVLTVLGLAIGISYATATKSLNSARTSQEHTEALEYLQQQAERLHYDQNDDRIYKPGTLPYFCLDGNNNPQPITGISGLSDLQDDSHYASCRFGPQNTYDISIQNNNDGNDTFTLRAYWPRIGGGTDAVSMVYRVHKTQ